MRGTPPGRKTVFKDLRVIAALEALKAAVLAVNGDKEVTNEIVFFDVKTRDGAKGMSTMNMNICGCPACVNRVIDMIGGELNDAAGEYVTEKRKAVH